MAKQLEITDIEIKGLKPRGKVFTKHFGGGFYVYVLPKGRKVCRYCYQADGKIKRYELGDYVTGKGKLKELVAEYNRVHSNRIHNKVDPVAENDTKKAKVEAEKAQLEAEQRQQEAEALKESGRISFAEVAGKFLEKYQGLKGGRPPAPRTMKDYKSHLDRMMPLFGHYPMAELPDVKIMDYLDDVATDHPVMANRLFATLSVVCTWAVKQKRYQLRKNPFAGMDKPAGKEAPKNRVLDFRPKHKKFQDKGEIKQLWLWQNTINQEHATAFRLALLTGLRIGEVLSLEWDDIDDDEIILPAEKTKNKKGIHRLPVTPKLKILLDDLKSIPSGSGYLFKARQFKTGEKLVEAPVKPATLSRLLSKALASGGALHGMEKFTTHDLRRTCATHIGDLGFSMSDVGLLLNHSHGLITERYNYADDAAKKTAMLESWHRRLDQLIEGKEVSNVVGIRT